MNAKELRIGNYYDHNGMLYKVTPSVIFEVFDSPRVWCKPIPLTEEWLVNLGFAPHSTSITMGYTIKDYILNKFSVSFNIHEGMGYSIQKDNFFESYGRQLTYVHQLQNLYFALTGEELTLK